MRRLTIGALVSAIGVVAALSIPARAQAPAKPGSTAAAKPYTTPKTPWGDPDISGTWSSDDLRNVPVQRPTELGNKAQLTDEEYAKRLAAKVHDTRIMPLDGRPHLSAGIRQYMVDARGHFEGDTLVVETTNFMGNTTGVGGNGGGPPTSDVLHVIERFTRVASDVLNYEVSITDPKTFSRPVKLLLPLTTQPGYQVLPYECHEGNHALHNILSAARAEDRAVEDAVKKGLPRPKPSTWQGGVNPAAPEQ